MKTIQLLKIFNEEIPARLKLVTKEAWFFLALTLLTLFIGATCVELTPSVDNNIFFSSDDPQFQSEHQINRLFIRQDSQLIISAKGYIQDPNYRDKIGALSKRLLELPGVITVNSLTHFGPDDLRDAMKSPLWKRLIVSHDQKSTNVIVLLDEKLAPSLIPLIEEIMNQLDDTNFELHASGLPYVIELIKRNLLRDLVVFSSLAVLIFGLFIFFIFKSKSVLAGSILSCLNACLWTIMLANLFGIPMGLLTANLGTVVFIMTLSHIIFLTYSWRRLRGKTEGDIVEKAMHETFPPSFWSMFTTFLGFISLMAVPAKPLRDLGIAGSIGALVAIATAYTVFPAFLRMARKAQTSSKIEQYEFKTYQFFNLGKHFITAVVIVTCLITLPGLFMINSDPSLLAYFSKGSDIHKGLEYIDQNGGSSPLILVVRRQDNTLLKTDKNYEKLWALQESLEQHRSVGSVISLPVLIAQAKDSPFGWFLSKDFLIWMLEGKDQEEIAKSFITRDRRYGLYMLRMVESFRTIPRIEVVEEIKTLAKSHGFYPELTGGIYNLQGHLAKLVASSLVFGLMRLFLLFALIVWFISRSLRVTLAVTASIFILPLTILGFWGVYRIPLDVISAPASNVAIAMGIDSMIHMIKSYRRNKDWQKVRDELWQPVMTAMLVVCAGFSIFLFSTFPPTQRFGLAIVVGTFIAALTALFIMPLMFDKFQLDRWQVKIKKHLIYKK